MAAQQITWWDRLKTNLLLSYRMAINWWMLIVGMAWEGYRLSDPETQLAILSWLPVDTARLPSIALGIGFVIRIWPQIKLQWATQQALNAPKERTQVLP